MNWGFDRGSGEWCVGEANGCKFTLDVSQGHLTVEHDGTITWEQLQSIKTIVWGRGVRAIEVYPADNEVVNNGNIRHLWRLGPNDFCPDLHGRDNGADSLKSRHSIAWAEARK